MALRLASPLVLAAALALSAPASANDSSAEKAAGGIELVENENVAMVSEDLAISPTRIDVSYVFRNEGDADEALTVAFPLPPIDGYGVSMQNVALPFPDRKNFVGFTITVDGKTVTPELDERAYLGENEVTDKLKSYGLPLNPIGEAFAGAASALSEEDYAKLQKAGLMTERDLGEALWRYEATFHFDETFPAGKDVAVEHSYAPVRGLYFLERTSLGEADYAEKYCIDAGTKKALESVIRKAGAALLESDPENNASLRDDPLSGLGASIVVPYILTTANNWSGPIGRFHLAIDKGEPANVVSLCQDGLKKTGPTTFEFTAKDYVPKRDLLVLFGGVDFAAVGVE